MMNHLFVQHKAVREEVLVYVTSGYEKYTRERDTEDHVKIELNIYKVSWCKNWHWLEETTARNWLMKPSRELLNKIENDYI